MVWGQLLGAGLGVGASLYEGNKAKKRKRQLEQLAQRQFGRQRALGEQQVGQARKGLEARTKGYDKAAIKTASAARTAKRDALDRQKEIASQLATRFGGSTQTTAYQNALSGLSSRSARELATVDSMFAEALSNLAVGRGQAEAQGRAGISGALGNVQGITQDYYSTLAGIQGDPSLQGVDAYDLLGAAFSGAGAGAKFGF